MPYWIYIIQNDLSGKLYTGQTSNLEKRLARHNDKRFDKKRHTRRFEGNWILIHSEQFESRVDAMKREKFLKSGRGRDWIEENISKNNSGGC